MSHLSLNADGSVAIKRVFNDQEYAVTIARKVITDLQAARGMVIDLADNWNSLKTHIETPGGSPRPPRIPYTNLNIVLDIEKAQLLRVLSPSGSPAPVYVACILCMNSNETSTSLDDRPSVLLVGLDQDYKPTPDFALEKWPGLDGGGSLDDKATWAKNNVLNPHIDLPNPAQFDEAKKCVDAFVLKWKELVRDTSGTIQNPRPAIRLADHPIAYIFPAKVFNALIPASAARVACVFGYSKPAGDHGFVSPLFVGVDGNNKPVTEILFCSLSVPYRDLSQDALVRSVFLTL